MTYIALRQGRSRPEPKRIKAVGIDCEVAVKLARGVSLFSTHAIGHPSMIINSLIGLVPRRPPTAYALARLDKQVIGRAVATPRWYRFPFMGANDLQIGDVWTHPDHQGKGLATVLCDSLLDHLASEDGDFWWISDSTNAASLRVAAAIGFTRVATASKTAPLGKPILGQYVLAPS